MSEIHEIKASAEAGKYEIQYKRTIQDIDGKDVVILADKHVKTVTEIEDEIARWEQQKTNADNAIVKLGNELTEIGKL